MIQRRRSKKRTPKVHGLFADKKMKTLSFCLAFIATYFSISSSSQISPEKKFSGTNKKFTQQQKRHQQQYYPFNHKFNARQQHQQQYSIRAGTSFQQSADNARHQATFQQGVVNTRNRAAFQQSITNIRKRAAFLPQNAG